MHEIPLHSVTTEHLMLPREAHSRVTERMGPDFGVTTNHLNELKYPPHLSLSKSSAINSLDFTFIYSSSSLLTFLAYD
jgi:hypothetical protein